MNTQFIYMSRTSTSGANNDHLLVSPAVEASKNASEQMMKAMLAAAAAGAELGEALLPYLEDAAGV